MNSYTGDIERFPKELLDKIPVREQQTPFGRFPFKPAPPPTEVPEGWLLLTEEEAAEFETLPKRMRIERYMKYHREDKCANCGGFVGNHSTNKFLQCAASELARVDILRLEKEEVPA
jgi:hypothetical protein